MMLLERIHSLSHWQIDVAFFWILLQGAVLSIAPEEVVVITLGLLWGQGKVAFPEALISVLAGLLPANSLMVYAGGRLVGRFAEKRGVKIAAEYLARYGAGLIFLTRFTPLVRAPVYLAVGASRYGVFRFFRTDAIAACFQIPLLLWVGHSIGARAGSIGAAFRMIAWIAGSLLTLTILSTAVLEWRKKSVELKS